MTKAVTSAYEEFQQRRTTTASSRRQTHAERESVRIAGLCLPHPVGVVIGEGSVIGTDVTIYQGVTLGRASHEVDAYPTIDDGAVIYAGATLLGPIRIGRNAVVAAHSVVLSDVPDFATVVGAPARIVRTSRPDDSLPTADVGRAASSR